MPSPEYPRGAFRTDDELAEDEELEFDEEDSERSLDSLEELLQETKELYKSLQRIDQNRRAGAPRRQIAGVESAYVAIREQLKEINDSKIRDLDESSRKKIGDRMIHAIEYIQRADHAANRARHPELYPVRRRTQQVRLIPPAPEPEYLDTTRIARQISEKLEKLAIPPAKFAENVLSSTRSTFLSMLSAPRPWNKVTDEEKGSFSRMNAFLMLSNRAMIDVAAMLPKNAQRALGFNVANRRAPRRGIFTDEQKKKMKKVFKTTRNVDKELFKSLGDELRVPECSVAQYFRKMMKRRNSRAPHRSF